MNWGDERLPERFWTKVYPCPMSGCWLWCGALTSKGYGSFNVGKGPRGKQVTSPAHVHMWRACNGQRPRWRKDRPVVDHKCRIRCCVNPYHLRMLRNSVNVRIGESPSAHNATKTHCPHGHEYTLENTYALKVGGSIKRYCLACRREKRYA